jgi:hypothetical protein
LALRRLIPATRSCGSKRAYQEGAAFVLTMFPVDVFRLRLRVAHRRSSGSRRVRVALAPWFLRAICSIPSFGISKFAANVWFRDTNKNANKTDGWSQLLLVFSMHRENFLEKSGIEPMA